MIRPGVRRAAVGLIVGLLAACSHGGDTPATDAAAAAPADSSIATPVGAAIAERTTLDVTVTAPGRTEALKQDRVRAPFPSRLVSLRVTDGDRVTADEVVAEIVSKSSQAALQGAEDMLGAARTAADSAEARRAVAISRRNLVIHALHAPADGVVLSHAAETGDYLDENEVLLTITEAGGVYFDAQVSQADVARVRPGDRATIDMPAMGESHVAAVVHGILPSASSQNLSSPMRLDFSPPRAELPIGLFGTATIVVATRPDVVVVPAAAVLTDDVTGSKRVAVIGGDGHAHWVEVRTGVSQSGHVELQGSAIPAGTRVIVSGQVGLPEGARVRVVP